MDQTLLTYLLTFGAVFAAVASLWDMFAEVARASAERLDETRAAVMRSEEIGKPLDRFVTGGQLLRLRIAFGLIPVVAVFAVLMLSHVEKVGILIGVPLAAGALVSFLPKLYYRWRVLRRQIAFENAILDLTNGICNALRAGMALPQAFEKVGEQMHGPMRDELMVVLREYRLGVDLIKALERLYLRMPCEDIRLLVCAIKLTTEAGGSLSSVLVEMSAMIRGRREFADKVKALTAEGRFEAIAMSCAPLAAFGLLHCIQPELMRPLYTTGLGWITLGVVVGLEVAGYLVIRKIVSIEI